MIAIKYKRLLIIIVGGLVVISAVLAGGYVYLKNSGPDTKLAELNRMLFDKVMGIATGPGTSGFPIPVLNQLLPTPTFTPTPTITLTPTPTKIPYSITLINAPSELTEGDNAAFTWRLEGPMKTIHTTTIYYGLHGSSAPWGYLISPQDTLYTDMLKDFIQGDYDIPMQFVGNAKFTSPGTYFFRAYALIDTYHFWTEEHSIVVKPAPKHEIKVISFPATVSPGATATFTWEIDGPAASGGFTAIVAGKQSKPGLLGKDVSTTMTPYSVIINDFTSGKFTVPLRFVGNALMKETGVFYFRAVAFINDKNIWSDEASFTVQ